MIRRLVQGAARHRARRDDRRRRAVPGGRARTPRLPHRQAPDRVPEPDDVAVDDHELRRRAVPRARHHDHRPAAARDHRRADHLPRAVVAARAHALRRSGAGDGDQRRPRPPHRHQPEDHVDRDLDDRRLPLGRRRSSSTRPQQGSAELVAIGPETLLLGLSAALIARHDVVPEGGRRRDRRRAALPGARVQLPERDRARAVRAVRHRARARRAHQQRRRRGRRELLVRAARPAGARTAARDLVGAPHAASSPASRCWSRSSCRSLDPRSRRSTSRTRSSSRSRSARCR